ncbi:hypothetical protein [Nocardia transvalensis]|nr:hypothetical protein [Nocardia transvalensis]
MPVTEVYFAYDRGRHRPADEPQPGARWVAPTLPGAPATGT